MKRIIVFGGLLLVSFITQIVAQVTEHKSLLYIGLIFGAMVLIAMGIGLFKLIMRFIGRSLTSVLYVMVSLGVVGFLSWHKVIHPFVGFAIGAGLSGIMVVLLFRKLARIAQKSIIFGEVFSFLSNYEVKALLHKDTIVPREVVAIEKNEYNNIVLVLKNQGFTKSEAKVGAQHALEMTEIDAPLENKIKAAFQYLGNSNNKMAVN